MAMYRSNIPINTVENSRVGFGPTVEYQLYTLEDIISGDPAGSTETDSQTDPAEPGYSRINQKSGKPVRVS